MMLDEEKDSQIAKEEEELEDKKAEKSKKVNKIDELNEKIEKLTSEVNHWKNEYYRAYADTKNLRANLEKDHKEAIKYRIEGFVAELLPILDSFQSVLGKEVEDPNLKNYLVGFNFVYRNLVSVLENEGVKEIAPKVGDEYDNNSMNAVDSVEGEPINKITKIYGFGYKLHDHLIRPAMVQVSVDKKPSENNDEAHKDA